MKINAIRFNNKKSVMTGQESELKALILFSALFACGMIIGAGIFNADIGTTNFIKNILNDMFLINESGAAANVLLNSLIINIGLVLLQKESKYFASESVILSELSKSEVTFPPIG